MIEEIKRDGRPGSSAIWLAGQHDSHPNQPKQQETISKGYESCSQTFRRLWPLVVVLMIAVVALLGLAARLLLLDDCRPGRVEIGSAVHIAGCRS